MVLIGRRQGGRRGPAREGPGPCPTAGGGWRGPASADASHKPRERRIASAPSFLHGAVVGPGPRKVPGRSTPFQQASKPAHADVRRQPPVPSGIRGCEGGWWAGQGLPAPHRRGNSRSVVNGGERQDMDRRHRPPGVRPSVEPSAQARTRGQPGRRPPPRPTGPCSSEGPGPVPSSHHPVHSRWLISSARIACAASQPR